MVFKIDFIDGQAITWHKKSSGEVESSLDKDYHPRFYINSDNSRLQQIRPWLTQQPETVATCFEHWKPTLKQKKQKVLRIDTRKPEDITQLRNKIKYQKNRPKYRFFNAGLSPQFQYCLQRNTSPAPQHKLKKIELTLPRIHYAKERLHKIKVNGEKQEEITENQEIIHRIREILDKENPDIIMVDRAQTLQLIKQKSREHDISLQLGRRDGFQKLAGTNTVQSYGKTVHKNTRVNIPGRILIDKSNSFLIQKTSLKGLLDLVERSYRPIQELAWSSIGRTLTSIETRKAYLEKDTLTPWKNWNYEKPKKASTLHKADTGGFIFNPEPQIHRDVYQADFASLFPNIMIKKNISPETICCSCCNNQKTPQLEYNICDRKRGFIPEVLKPLVEDRQDMKEEFRELPEESERYKELKAQSEAIKWLLVSCFGYMGHAHASFGAIECHQAIQAYDRKIMLQAKEKFEENGYQVVHGIIDSLWVQKKEDQVSTDFEKVCREVSNEIDILLEPEGKYEWCAFVPRTNTDAKIGTLNRYFGKKQKEGFEMAGIETEQQSTCQYVKDAQKEMIKALDHELNTSEVINVLESKINELKNSDFAKTHKLAIEKKAHKSLESYKVENRTVAAIKRARMHDIEFKPGQKIKFLVVNDDAEGIERVRLDFEQNHEFDEEFYKEKLIKAAASVLLPKGVTEEDIKTQIEKSSNISITKYS